MASKNKNRAKSVEDLTELIRKKLELMKTRADRGERPRIEGISDVLYKEDWQKELKRDIEIGQLLKSAITQPQDTGGEIKEGFFGKRKTKSKPIKGKSILDLVKLAFEQKKAREEFIDWHGDYDKAAEQEISKQKSGIKYQTKNEIYEEGK